MGGGNVKIWGCEYKKCDSSVKRPVEAEHPNTIWKSLMLLRVYIFANLLHLEGIYIQQKSF